MNNYQARLDSIVEDFGAPESGTAAPDVGSYQDKVPEALIDFWQQNGIGTILDGYFQLCDPARYSGILKLVFAGAPHYPSRADACPGLRRIRKDHRVE
ncbi:GAD-like domain-containing protein [Rhizobium aethiopicum]|uniref:GAD-like domain-containing protein n=1 Tax=Rhizobium aethiopicum TaxID=1138170 RepID=A0A1C3Y3C4_9HYPH|nr:GAD-like domain-containing protein [Rhizobium aethiopicum]SCB58939.1 GAD-like domain-containing protein [Rhizobium aethiopicum]